MSCSRWTAPSCALRGRMIADRPALDPGRDAWVDPTTKGFPTVDGPIPLGEVAAQGWSLEDLLPPVLLLRESALAHNIALMADYCAARGVELAPHGKTTMAPSSGGANSMPARGGLRPRPSRRPG